MSDTTRDTPAEMVGLVADESIKEEGFLSPVIDVFAHHLEEENQHVFDVARRLNRLVFEGWQGSPNEGKGDDFEPVMNRIMLRAMNAFAGAVILAKRGMDAESQAVSRSIFECAFWLGYMKVDQADALYLFKLDSQRGVAQHRQSMARVVPETVSGEELEQIAAFLKGTNGKVPGPKKLADDGGMESAYVYYKALCGLAGHSTMSSIDRYLVDDGNGTLGHEINVSGDGIPETMGYACFGLCAAYTQFGALTRSQFDIEAVVPILKEIEAMFGADVDPTAVV